MRLMRSSPAAIEWYRGVNIRIAVAITAALLAPTLAIAQTPRPTPQPSTPPAPAADTLPARSLPTRGPADSLPRPSLDLPADSLRAAALELLPPAARRAIVRICSGGDVAFGTNLSTAWRTAAAARWGVRESSLPEPATLAARIRDLLPPADVVLLNVEGAIGDGDAPSKCGPNSTACYAIRMPPSSAADLRSVAPDATVVGTVANNHARDAGAVGFATTRELLSRAGVLVTGADTIATPIPTALGDTIGVLGFATSPGTSTDLRDLAAVRRHVQRASERFGRVVVTAHLGAEGIAAQRTPDSTEVFYGTSRGNPVAFAHAAVDAGASLVIGHGPHVLRAIEWRDDALIAYSLGNLLTFGPFSTAEPLNRGALLCATIDEEGRVAQAAIVPTVQTVAGRLERDPRARAAVLIDSLSQLDFPRTGARVTRSGQVERRVLP